MRLFFSKKQDELPRVSADDPILAAPAIWPLIEDLYDPRESVRAASEEKLMQMNPEQVVYFLGEKLRKPALQITRAHKRFLFTCIHMLKALEHPSALELLSTLINCSNKEVAKAAAEAVYGEDGKQSLEQVFRNKKRKERRLRLKKELSSSLIALGVLALLGALAFIPSAGLFPPGFGEVSDKIPFLKFILRFGLPMLIVPILVLLGCLSYRRFTKSKPSIQTDLPVPPLELLGDTALTAKNAWFTHRAPAALKGMLEQVDEEHLVALTPPQIKALNDLLVYQDAAFVSVLIHALGFIGDETTLEALQRFSESEFQPGALRNEAKAATFNLWPRIMRQSASNVLLRAAAPQEDGSRLLRAASDQTEIPKEQLLRPTLPE